jgi:hypothetical protein
MSGVSGVSGIMRPAGAMPLGYVDSSGVHHAMSHGAMAGAGGPRPPMAPRAAAVPRPVMSAAPRAATDERIARVLSKGSGRSAGQFRGDGLDVDIRCGASSQLVAFKYPPACE